MATAAAGGASLAEIEETYELRLEKVLREKGSQAMLAVMKKDMAEDPRPYVKAWYGSRIVWKKNFGLDLPEAITEGYELIQQSAAEGSLTGLEFQGRCLVHGEGGQARQPKVGAEMLRRAAEMGRYTAMAEISRLYVSGFGVPKDMNKADYWARRASYYGSPDGLFYLGTVWEDGKYTSRVVDSGRAAGYYFDASWCGSREAMKRFAALVQKEDATAQMFMRLSTIEHVNMTADLMVLSVDGELLPSRIRRDVAWLEKNAPGSARAKLAVAQIRLKRLQPVYDPAKARRLLESLASEGNDDAIYWLAHARYEGIGQKTDRAGALEIWRGLALKKHPLALNKLGMLSYWGHDGKLGFPKDPVRAYEYVREAAENGCWLALFNLANCYEFGIGTEPNYYKAAKCWSILEDMRVPEATRRKNAALAHVRD